MNALKNDLLGMRAIDTVKHSDAKEWAIRMSIKCQDPMYKKYYIKMYN